MMSADRLNLLLSVVQSEDCTVEEKVRFTSFANSLSILPRDQHVACKPDDFHFVLSFPPSSFLEPRGGYSRD